MTKLTASGRERRRNPRPNRGSRRLSLRRCTVADVPALLAHRRGMLREIGSFSAPVLEEYLPRFRRWLVPRLRSAEVIAFGLANADGRLVGSGCVWFAPDHPRPDRRRDVTPYLFSMYTEPAFRGRGVASRVVRAALRAAREAGSDRMRLHAAPKARRLYRELGFTRGWEMRRRLAPVRRAPGHRA